MSNTLFPELLGLEWNTTKTPVFNTMVMESVNGRELRASYSAVPKYEINLSYGFLRENRGRVELQQLESFFVARRGSFDSFLFKFPDDNQYDCEFVGDDITTQYQLYKQIYDIQVPLIYTEAASGIADPLMWNQDDQKSMWSSNTSKLMWSHIVYNIDSNGALTLSPPLEDGQTLVITGTYYYRCRFADDMQEYTNFMSKLWSAKKVALIGSLGNKI